MHCCPNIQALHDLLVKCFKKEPRLRSSAEELLRHPWIASIPKNKVQQSAQFVEDSNASNDDRDVVLNTIKLYSKTADGNKTAIDVLPTTSIQKGKLEQVQEHEEEDWDDEFGVESTPAVLSLDPKTSERDAPQSKVQAQMRALRGSAPSTPKTDASAGTCTFDVSAMMAKLCFDSAKRMLAN